MKMKQQRRKRFKVGDRIRCGDNCCFGNHECYGRVIEVTDTGYVVKNDKSVCGGAETVTTFDNAVRID